MPPKKTFVFRPPKNNRTVTFVARHVLLPLLLRPLTGIVRIDVGEEDLRRLRELAGRRVVLTPNHSEENEPIILFHLSKLLGYDFNYLTAKELFEAYRGFSWFFQGIGAYSIMRGTADLSSFRTTRRLLIEGRRWLVIFPEGVAVGLGDMVMPFQPGVMQLAFSAQEELAKTDPPSSVLFVPVAIKYLYLHDMTKAIDHTLRRLERKAGLRHSGQGSAGRRLARLGEAVISRNEQIHGLEAVQGMGLDDRMDRLREALTHSVAMALGIRLNEEEPLIQRLRVLQNAIEAALDRESRESRVESATAPDELELQALAATVTKVRNFAVMHTAYIEARPTVERLFDVLGLLELELFGKRRFQGPRRAVVRVGEPVSLLEYRDRFRKERDVVAAEVAGRLESSVRDMLEALSEASRPLRW